MKPSEKLAFDRSATKDRLMLVDGHALIYRAFHAFPELTDAQGRLVNAIYGFSRILLAAIRDFHPEYLIVCFDHKDKTNRAKEYDAYKAHRKPMPEELKPQIEVIKEVVTALNIPQFSLAGYEADDLIGTIAKILDDKPTSPHVLILTGDRDLLQVVTNNIHVYIPARSRQQQSLEYDRDLVKRMMGVWPEQIPDLKALMGDASDNIPGVPGIGPKGATTLIETFETVDNLYEVVDLVAKDPEKVKVKPEYQKVLNPKMIEKLANGHESALMSRELATIKSDVPLKLDLEECRVRKYEKDKAIKIFEELGFKSLISLLPQDEFETTVQQALF